jgi:hypothetical protein
LAFSVPAFGNGGPVDWTKATPMGGLALNDKTDIRLAYESLNIRLHDDLYTYSVEATYHLRNDAEEKAVRFGVPLTWPRYISNRKIYSDNETPPDSAEVLQKNIKLVSGKVHLDLDGQEITCSPVPGDSPDDTGIPAHEGASRTTLFDIQAGWCLADLKIKGKSESVLTMRYEAGLYYEDMEFSKSALTRFSFRKLLYLFYPAGSWEGTVGKVDITLDLGPYRTHLKSAAPAYTGRTGSTLEWHLEDVDFREFRKLEVVLTPELFEERQLARWNRDALPYRRGKLEARASSSLPDSNGLSYAPSNVTDGNERTAWCEGAQGDGTGEWLELRLLGLKEKESRPYCRIEGISIVPAYAKSQKSYLDNGRVTKVRIGHCSSEQSAAVDVPVEEDVMLSPYLIKNRWDEAGKKFMKEFERKHGDNYSHPDYKPPADVLDFIMEDGCFRVEILEVEKGRFDDACISEIAVVFNCL